MPEPDETLPEPDETLPEPESVNPPANAREIDESRWRRGFDPDYRKGGGKFVGKGVILHGPALAAYAGLETTFLFPILSPASTYATTIDALETVQVDQNDATIDGNLFMSPRVWIGLQHGTWGMEARYFRMGASKHEFFPQSPLVPRNYSAMERLSAWNADIEVFKKWITHFGDDRRLSLGFRYATLDVADEVSMDYVTAGDFAIGSALATREMEGPGVTFALQGSHITDLWKAKNSHTHDSLKWFWNFRGSIIFANVFKTAHSDAIVFDPNTSSGATTINTAIGDGSDVAVIAELQLGMQYERELALMPARFILRGGVEYQYWGVDGGYASVGSTAFSNNVTIVSAAEADNLNLNLIGAFVSAGLSW